MGRVAMKGVGVRRESVCVCLCRACVRRVKGVVGWCGEERAGGVRRQGVLGGRGPGGMLPPLLTDQSREEEEATPTPADGEGGEPPHTHHLLLPLPPTHTYILKASVFGRQSKWVLESRSLPDHIYQMIFLPFREVSEYADTSNTQCSLAVSSPVGTRLPAHLRELGRCEGCSFQQPRTPGTVPGVPY